MDKKTEALKLALEALEYCWSDSYNTNGYKARELSNNAIAAIRRVLAQPEQEPVAWLITDEKINSLQVDSIQRLIDRARHAHMTDIKLRINGQDEWYQADWLKHLIRATLPQRTWAGLTDDEKLHIEIMGGKADVMLAEMVEVKLKQKNGFAEEKNA